MHLEAWQTGEGHLPSAEADRLSHNLKSYHLKRKFGSNRQTSTEDTVHRTWQIIALNQSSAVSAVEMIRKEKQGFMKNRTGIRRLWCSSCIIMKKYVFWPLSFKN